MREVLEEFREEGTEPAGKGQSHSWEITADFPQGLRSPGVHPKLDAEILGWRLWRCRRAGNAGKDWKLHVPGQEMRDNLRSVTPKIKLPRSCQQPFTPNYPPITSEHRSGRYQDNLLLIRGKKTIGIVRLQCLQFCTEDPAQETQLPALPKIRHSH